MHVSLLYDYYLPNVIHTLQLC